ncbi:copper amine oxidase N-terminal domain-containing protein [Paenibacillus sp. YYML68]|uniref:copper amine oxidase N-terminal domain-containing protein n=1 Tax=Paenibacillus sp. YYML68 TaxID=2909250 RepID=UPI0028525133|nr:copper amine oxidase N-terminal domain-containing protein [Paenibacillus sp. YYML68]
MPEKEDSIHRCRIHVVIYSSIKDDEPLTLVQAAELVNGTMVPVRFVSEALGAEVGWDAATRTVLITQE